MSHFAASSAKRNPNFDNCMHLFETSAFFVSDLTSPSFMRHRLLTELCYSSSIPCVCIVVQSSREIILHLESQTKFATLPHMQGARKQRGSLFCQHFPLPKEQTTSMD